MQVAFPLLFLFVYTNFSIVLLPTKLITTTLSTVMPRYFIGECYLQHCIAAGAH